MNAVGVVAALEAEARTLGSRTRRRDGLWALGDGALMAVGGMGLGAAATAALRLVAAGSARLVSFGLAGGLDPALRAGALVLPSVILSRSGARLTTSSSWREQFRLAVDGCLPVTGGALLTSAMPLCAAADKAAAFGETGAVAVDMESFAIAEVAATHGLPFIAVRVIIDTAADAVPRAVAAASQAGEVSIRRLVVGLASSPWELIDVIGLWRRYRTATRVLAGVAGAVLPAPLAGADVA